MKKQYHYAVFKSVSNYPEQDTIVTAVRTDAVTTSEVVRAFYQFAIGAGHHPQNVASAMEEYGQEVLGSFSDDE